MMIRWFYSLNCQLLTHTSLSPTAAAALDGSVPFNAHLRTCLPIARPARRAWHGTSGVGTVMGEWKVTDWLNTNRVHSSGILNVIYFLVMGSNSKEILVSNGIT